MTTLTWLGIVLCVLQSGMFSGLNLAVFGAATLQLKALAKSGNEDAARLLDLRRDSNFLLTTILWGNVGTNVLLTLLSDSVLAGAFGFLFSTFVITFGGEIVPQAYFSRNALHMASLLRPALRFWQFVLFPIAKPSALILDAWLGREGFYFLREKELGETIKLYTSAPESEVSEVEGIGALNFLMLDDLHVSQEGEPIDPESIISLPERKGSALPEFPAFRPTPDDPFLTRVQASGQAWVVIVSSESSDPLVALDADGFLRAAVFSSSSVDVLQYCHRPIVVRQETTRLEEVLPRLKVHQENAADDVIDEDLILLWGAEKRVITGADLLGRLLRGISKMHQKEDRLKAGAGGQTPE